MCNTGKNVHLLGDSNEAYEFIIAACQPRPVPFWVKNSADLFNTNQATPWLGLTWQLRLRAGQGQGYILERSTASSNLPQATEGISKQLIIQIRQLLGAYGWEV